MSKKWTHTETFKHFGTAPTNVQWSWSARNENDKVVVVTLWQDQFDRVDGRVIYERPASDPENRDNRLGLRELMNNLAWAKAHCAGRFSVIIAIAKDITADPRSIKECFPSKMLMRLTNLDITKGAFAAEAEGL